MPSCAAGSSNSRSHWNSGLSAAALLDVDPEAATDLSSARSVSGDRRAVVVVAPRSGETSPELPVGPAPADLWLRAPSEVVHSRRQGGRHGRRPRCYDRGAIEVDLHVRLFSCSMCRSSCEASGRRAVPGPIGWSGEEPLELRLLRPVEVCAGCQPHESARRGCAATWRRSTAASSRSSPASSFTSPRTRRSTRARTRRCLRRSALRGGAARMLRADVRRST